MSHITITSPNLLMGINFKILMSLAGMWVEKYRPQKLSDVVNQTEIIGSLEALIKDPTDMPHLMFSGSAGVGKTTTALCITRQILGEYAKDYTLGAKCIR